MTKKLGLIFVIYLCAFGISSSAFAKRIALVIGNSAYENVGLLPNTVNDAELMTSALESSGFEVIKIIDADLKTMRKAMLDFGRALRGGAEASLFYYAGHGVQVNGENFLLPVSADIKDQEEIEFEGINVNAFLRVMKSSDSDVNIVVLDSCRNNPFAGSFRSVSRGLAPVRAPRGTYIAYATAPGDVAYDGKGKNSYYTAALAKAISTPGLEIAHVFRKTRESVILETDEKQIPWESSSITGEFFFTEPTSSPEDSAARKEIIAAKMWRTVSENESIEKLQKFIRQHADTTFAKLARERIQRLENRTERVAVNAPTRKTGKSSSATASSSALAFEAAKRIGTMRGWLLYLSKFADNKVYAELGQVALNELGAIGSRTSGGPFEDLEVGLGLSRAQHIEVQKRLAARGYNVGKPDGIFGRNTRAQILLYQGATGLAKTGYLSPKFLKSLDLRYEPGSAKNFTSGQLAQVYDHKDLELVGESAFVVEKIKCFSDTPVIYSKTNDRLYVAALRNEEAYFVFSAVEECGGYVVALESQEENSFVYSMIKFDSRYFELGGQSNAVWREGPLIGLVKSRSSIGSKGGWRWSNGKSLSFRNWDQNRPFGASHTDEYARFAIIRSKKKGIKGLRADKWSDHSGFTNGFIAEFEIR